MTNLKKLSQRLEDAPPPPKTKQQTQAVYVGFRSGFTFSFGFWTGTLIYFIILLPILACIAWIALMVFGATVAGLVEGMRP
jgi:hypothetical protein